MINKIKTLEPIEHFLTCEMPEDSIRVELDNAIQRFAILALKDNSNSFDDAETVNFLCKLKECLLWCYNVELD